MAMDSPLLNKLTVNLTPNGTMIFIPAFWSFDSKRDLDWKEITRLHRARSAKKQGVKLARNQAAAKAQAERALQLSESATRAGLKGSRKQAWIMEQLGLDARTDESYLRRLLKKAAAAGGGGKSG
jgi:DNA-binding CsgD family transcriptional regulator